MHTIPDSFIALAESLFGFITRTVEESTPDATLNIRITYYIPISCGFACYLYEKGSTCYKYCGASINEEEMTFCDNLLKHADPDMLPKLKAAVIKWVASGRY
jgi:hypothetical protein